MAKTMQSKRIKAEGDTLILRPVLVNKYGQKVYVAKNPRRWQTNYSVWAYTGKGWGDMLVSHHKTNELATAAARRLRNKDVLRALGWR